MDVNYKALTNMKSFNFYLATITSLLFLTGCDPNGAVKQTKLDKIEEKTEVKQVKTAKPGQIIYNEKHLQTHPALRLHNSVNTKHSSFFAPKLHLRKGELLVRLLENKKYEYYAIQKHSENLREFFVSSLTAKKYNHVQNVQGIRRDKETGELDGFVISSDREYAFDLPKTLSWENTSAYPSKTKNSQSTIRYLGIKNNELIFNHYDFEHTPKRFGKDRHHELNKTVKAPRDAKTVTIDHHVIQIIKAVPGMLKYKIIQ